MPKTGDLPSQRMLSVYLNIQVTFLIKNTTLDKCLALPKQGMFNSPFTCQLKMLLFLGVFLEFTCDSEIVSAIRLVRVLDNQRF